MAVKIRLKRLGKIRQPYYRIVVVDGRKKRDGRVIEEVGKYHPTEQPSLIEFNSERIQYWLSVGAQPTDRVLAQLKLTGEWAKFKGEENPEVTLKVKEEDGQTRDERVEEIQKQAEKARAEAAEKWAAERAAAEADKAEEEAPAEAEAPAEEATEEA